MTAYDIIIQGGQSNAAGYGVGPVTNEYEPCEEIVYLDKVKLLGDNRGGEEKPFVIHMAEERLADEEKTLGDFSLTFSKKYMESGKLQVGRKILIVRAAVPSVGFQTGHWGIRAPLHKEMIKMTDYALSLNPENKVVGFLWHQGETDSVERNIPANYKKQLLETVFDVRQRYGNMPFIVGDFVSEWKSLNLDICKPIINVIKEVVVEVKNSAFIETVDLLSNNQVVKNEDNIHFSKESLHILGERYFEAFEKIL